jgi:hypothetical protein
VSEGIIRTRYEPTRLILSGDDEGERGACFFIFLCRNNTTLNVTPYRGSLKAKLAFEFLWQA